MQHRGDVIFPQFFRHHPRSSALDINLAGASSVLVLATSSKLMSLFSQSMYREAFHHVFPNSGACSKF